MRIQALISVSLVFLSSCRLFEYSPTDLGSRDPKPDANIANLKRIAMEASGPRRHFKIAVLADTHLWYDELKLAVARMNGDTTLDFVVIAGDITKFGYVEEYIHFSDILSRLKAPSLVGIGNHDLQADGKTLYKRLYGPTDFSFAYRGVKFIFFDDNARGIPCCVPDFEGLEAELQGAGDSLGIITVCHAPPLSDQLDSAQGLRMAGLFAKYRVKLSISGHTHNYGYGEAFQDGIPYLVADDIGDRNYATVTLSDTALSVERVFF